ncbi:MAG: hypothetical protein JW709_12545 [Sedimentisphaerales bacterium]|nr:hypothetical protein [Sedimentisphaerales bacterium]
MADEQQKNEEITPEPAPAVQADAATPTEAPANATTAAETPRDKMKGRGRHHRHMLVRYGKMGMVGLFKHDERHIPAEAKYVIVHSDRGMELGELIAPFFQTRGTVDLPAEQMEAYWETNGKDYPVSFQGRFVRFASDQDINEQRHLDMEAHEERKTCEEMIAQKELPMKLVTVEHLFGGDRIIYYFMADGRVDFRDLVRELAHQYQTRIEMRQVGARDEARLIADFETCGRECCCKNFLKVLAPVNMRMAKVQKATLDPSKISGRCGRLKCCLRYEDVVYQDLARRLPPNNTLVTTSEGEGVVVETQIITQLVKIRLTKTERIIVVPVEELNVFKSKGPTGHKEEPVEAPALPSSPEEETAISEDGNEPKVSTKKRRRRRKKRKHTPPQNGPEQTGGGQEAASSDD